MVHRAEASVLPPDISNCFAGCKDGFDYQKLIVTKCSHIFCTACLDRWFKTKHTCPLDQKALTPITAANIRSKKEDAKIDQNSDAGRQYGSPDLYIKIFAYYIRNDFSTLKKVLATKIRRIACSGLLKKESPVKKKPDKCSVCFEPFPSQIFFITSDKDRSKIGRFMHEDCWQETVDNESEILDISVKDLVEVAEKLPWPPKEPASPIKVFFIAIALPISIWALAMNTRVYHNKNFVLYLLSIPAMILFKVLSLITSGIKAIFTDKRA
jgi:hypothetical protein